MPFRKKSDSVSEEDVAAAKAADEQAEFAAKAAWVAQGGDPTKFAWKDGAQVMPTHPGDYPANWQEPIPAAPEEALPFSDPPEEPTEESAGDNTSTEEEEDAPATE